jgi:two-component system chemotaxis response regulator CheY
VVVTAVDQKATLLESIRDGATDFVVKPFERQRLSSLFRKMKADRSSTTAPETQPKPPGA